MAHLYVLEMRFDLGTLDSGERSLPFGLLVSFPLHFALHFSPSLYLLIFPFGFHFAFPLFPSLYLLVFPFGFHFAFHFSPSPYL